MRLYAVVHKYYALSWSSMTGFDNREQTFTLFRTRKAAKKYIDGFPDSAGYLGIVPFDSQEEIKHDARKKSEWEGYLEKP